jgi:integrase
MASTRFTEALVRKLPGPPPATKKVIHNDSEVPGHGLRITNTGHRAYVLRYTINRRERTLTIGDIQAWTLEMARTEARRLRVLVDRGIDPLQQRRETRDAATVNELLDHWTGNDGGDGNKRQRRAPSKEWRILRAGTVKHYRCYIERYIRPEFGARKAAEVSTKEIEQWHDRISQHGGRHKRRRAVPYSGNHAVRALSRAYALGIKEGLVGKNPCCKITLNPEVERQEYLKTIEDERLLAALLTLCDDPLWPTRRNARALLVLRFTGARTSEVTHLRWDQLNLEADPPTWTKLPQDVKQDALHHMPLSQTVADILREIRDQPAPRYDMTKPGGRALRGHYPQHKENELRGRGKRNVRCVCEHCRKPFMGGWRSVRFCSGYCSHAAAIDQRRSSAVVALPSPFVFPGNRIGKPVGSLRHTWQRALRMAGIDPLRIHDIRHSVASFLLNDGVSLPVIGGVLGHKRESSTRRYAHVFTATKQAAVEKLAAVVTLDKFKKRG